MVRRFAVWISNGWRIAAAIVLAAVWVAMLLLGRGALDRQIYEALYAGGRPAFVFIARLFTWLGEPTVLVAAGFAVALWFWRIGRARLGLVLLLVTLVGRGLAEVEKYAIGRPRPMLEPHLVTVKTWSFPSGHATSSMIFYLTVALVLSAGTRWRVIAPAAAILLSLLVGLSRVMLGVHWPSDVIGGWAFGAFWVLVSLPLSERRLKSMPLRR